MTEIPIKVVYWGPGLAGKSTNLLYVHSKMGDRATPVVRTADARELSFSFTPNTMPDVRVALHTSPGAVYYDERRAQMLEGASGVVFVADSTRVQANRESLDELRGALGARTLAMFVQYNKRDLPEAAPIAELAAALPAPWIASFEAVASRGLGVFETVRGAVRACHHGPSL